MLAFYFYVHCNFSKEFPGNRQVFRTLRAWSNHIIAVACGFNHLYSRLCTDVFEFGMRYSSEIGFAYIFKYLDFFSFLFVLNGWLVFFLQLKPVFIEVYNRMKLFDNRWETDLHTIVPWAFMTIWILMREIERHLYLEKLLFLVRSLFSSSLVSLVEWESNNDRLDDQSFLINLLVFFRCFVGLQLDVAEKSVLGDYHIQVVFLHA